MAVALRKLSGFNDFTVNLSMNLTDYEQLLSVLVPLTGILLYKDWSLKLSSSYRTCYQFEYHSTHACFAHDLF